MLQKLMYFADPELILETWVRLHKRYVILDMWHLTLFFHIGAGNGIRANGVIWVAFYNFLTSRRRSSGFWSIRSYILTDCFENI